MPDPRDAQSLIDAAEQAAKVGDYASAERMLREAADLQEAGPAAFRAELANTLNNLGVVCELTDNPVEAERCFRRAHQIAVDVLEPGHPFITTSRKNLEDFCAANGKDAFPPGETAQPKRAVMPTSEPEDRAVAAPPLTDLLADLVPAPPPPPPPPPPKAAHGPAPVPQPLPEPGLATSSRALAIGLVVLALLFAVFLARSLFFRQPSTTAAGNVATNREPAPAAPAPAAAANPAPTPPPTPVERPPEPRAKAAAPVKTAPPPSTRPAAQTAASGAITLVSAELCRNLRTGAGEWRCDAAGSAVRAGQLFFATRVKSATGTVVQHRWYQGTQLRKSVDLDIGANPGTGYRTYSRNTVSAGEWRIELRTRSGEVLHEERFTVR